MEIRIALADDHQLVVKSLSLLTESFPSCSVVAEAVNGRELLNKLACMDQLPDIVIVDVNMPVMDGIETTKMIAQKFPSCKVVALSMQGDDFSIITMLKAGACSYLQKEIHPDELERALTMIHATGYYNADAANVNFRRLIKKTDSKGDFHVTEKEKKFLELACSDLTYRQIAGQMHLSLRTIDGYRESLFHKFKVQSRVGMVMEGLKMKYITLK